MAERQWIAIDPSRFRQTERHQIGTATVVSSTSPYALPQAITAYDDKTSGAYAFEVKYIGAEEPVETFAWDDLRVVRGKNSGRVFRIELNHAPNLVENNQILEAVKTAITRVASKHGLMTENINIIRAVIDQNKNRLLITSVQNDADK